MGPPQSAFDVQRLNIIGAYTVLVKNGKTKPTFFDMKKFMKKGRQCGEPNKQSPIPADPNHEQESKDIKNFLSEVEGLDHSDENFFYKWLNKEMRDIKNKKMDDKTSSGGAGSGISK